MPIGFENQDSPVFHEQKKSTEKYCTEARLWFTVKLFKQRIDLSGWTQKQARGSKVTADT